MPQSKKKSWKEIPIGGIIDKPATALAYKTGSWRSFRPIWHKDRCIHCLQCWYVCPDFAIKAEGGKFIAFDYDYCKGCGLCAQICPVKPEKAITMITEQEARKNG